MRNSGHERRIISADNVGDNLEHCQSETVGVCTLRVTRQRKNKLTEIEGGGKKNKTNAHKLTYYSAEIIVYDIVF